MEEFQMTACAIAEVNKDFLSDNLSDRNTNS
jgi:hypothetical protein